MRSLLFLLALALLASACKMNVQMSDPPFTLDSLMTYDYKGLEKMVGADKLKDSLAHDATSNASVRYTWLLPGTRSAVRLQWTDTTRSTIAFASIFGYAPGASAWKTRDSVTVGIPIAQLEKINRTPFYFYNNAPKVSNLDNDLQVETNPGYVMMWSIDGKSESKLSGHVYAVRLNANIAQGKEQRADFFSSNSPEALASNPIVTEVTLDMHAVGFAVVVEKIAFTTSAGTTSTLPHIVTRSGRKDPRADSMNQVILKYFDIESFDPKAVTDFPWDVTFDVEMDESTVALRIKGTYMGPYPSDIDEMLFIGKDGDKREAISIPFHSLFAYDGYFNFLNKYWSASCKTKMEEAEECAGTLPSCSCYDIVATVVNKKVVLSLKGDCYPHAAAACNPQQEVTLSLEELKPYLSNFGKNIVVEQGYYEQSALKQFNIANNARYSMPQVFFVRFDIIYDDGVSGPDQAMMGFELLPSEYDPYNGEIAGWIRFDNIEQEPILLKGKFEEGGILELWDPQDGIAMKFPLRWIMDEGHFDQGYFEGGTAHETYSFIAMLYSNVEAFGERGD